ncbi:plastocyanin/azurin family copper-binding protein [Natronococcus sp.]|uniref:plastocyanin/azurin family copper-binding protein n=1 Tax=Natronococcus sp. TaxID=35747 RepID=UPI003A4D680B
MKETDTATRRNVLKIAGAAGAMAFVAGCTDGGNGNGEDPAEEENGEDPAEENGEDPAEENGEDPAEENGEDTENGEAIEPDTTIEFDAQTSGWVGIEPEEIADEENPTLTLQDGESYEIGWEESDGQVHNIELVDENDEVVDDYQTEESEEGGDDQFIEFDASDDIAEYVCRPHEGTMRGTIEIEANGNGEDEADEEENGEEEEENGEDEMDEENGEDTENGEDEENGEDTENGDDENGEDEEN